MTTRNDAIMLSILCVFVAATAMATFQWWRKFEEAAGMPRDDY